MPDAPARRYSIVLLQGEPLGIFMHGLAVFGLVGGLALAAAWKAGSTGGYLPSDAVSVPYALALFALATALVLLALRFVRSRAVFETLFGLAMLSGAWFLADIFLPSAAALAAGSFVVLLRFVWKCPFVMNLVLALGIAGIASGFAAGLSPNAVLILLTVLSFYDIVAVYTTGHMVRMARELGARGAPLTFLLTPLRPRDLFAPLPVSDGRPGMRLGTGDVALPAMLAVAAMRVGLLPAVTVLLGAVAGFAALYLLFLGQRRRAPVPALPVIALGSTLAYFASLLILRA